MDDFQINSILYGVSKISNFEIDSNRFDDEYEDFDIEGYKKREKEYNHYLNLNMTHEELSDHFDVDLQTLEKEIHIFAILNPCEIDIKTIDFDFRLALNKKREIEGLCWIKENNKSLTVNYLTDNLGVRVDYAKKIVQQHRAEQKMVVPITEQVITYIDILENPLFQKPIVQFFHKYPYETLERARKKIGYTSMNVSTFVNAVKALVEKNIFVPYDSSQDKKIEEKQLAEIVKYKEKNIYASTKEIANKFNISEIKITKAFNDVVAQYKKEKLDSYEIYFKGVLDEIDEVGDLCLDRFHASPNSSSRWLEIKMMGIEKKIRMLGLNAPAEFKIQQDVQVSSKEDRDAIVDAYFATQNML